MVSAADRIAGCSLRQASPAHLASFFSSFQPIFSFSIQPQVALLVQSTLTLQQTKHSGLETMPTLQSKTSDQPIVSTKSVGIAVLRGSGLAYGALASVATTPGTTTATAVATATGTPGKSAFYCTYMELLLPI